MNTRILRVITVMSLSAASLLPVFAARPYLTDDAGTVEVGQFELETGANFWKHELSAGIGLKHGITDRMDLGFALGYTGLPEDERSFSGAQLGLKFSFIPDLFAATATGDFGDDAYATNLILSHGLGPLSLDANLGMSAHAQLDDADLTYALCCHYDTDRFSVGAEFTGTQESLGQWQVGGNVHVVEWMAIDAALCGSFEKKPALCATAGFHFEFPLKKPADTKKE